MPHVRSIAALALAAACAGKSPRVAPGSPAAVTSPGAADPAVAARRAQLSALLDEQWQDGLAHAPEFASLLGDRRYNDRWSDRSPAAIADRIARTRQFLARFEAIDTTGFPEQEVLNHQLMVRGLRDYLADARFEYWLMPVDQMSGVHIHLATLVASLPFATVKDYDDYIARLRTLPAVLAEATERMTAGVARHLVPPRILLEQCVGQAEKLADGAPADSPFAAPLQKFPAGIASADRERIRTSILAAVRDQVQPSYRAFAAYLRNDYVPSGRGDVGLWALPDGDARYAAAIRDSTTVDWTADQIHQIGRAEVARIEAEQGAIAGRLGFADLAALQRHVRDAPALHARSGDDVLRRYQAATDQMSGKLPMLFGRLPRQKLAIVPIEAFRAKEFAAAAYLEGTLDGSRPGRIQVNLYEPTRRVWIDMEAIAYHEGVPGHHLQVAIQQELGGLPPFRQHGNYAAFAEGWALYAEGLGKEVGLYQDPYSDYGRLQSELWRAIRLVVDTGLHAKHWTREQVVQYFHDHSTIDEPSVQAETDRYIAWPGQALAYKIGQLTIRRLRDKAQAALGARFDIRAFHDQVLGAGALPLDVLERRIDAWLQSSIAASTAAR